MAPKRNYFKSKGKVETKEDSKVKDNSQEQQNTTKDQGMISELPVLTYADNKPKNFLIFKEKLSIYLCQRHSCWVVHREWRGLDGSHAGWSSSSIRSWWSTICFWLEWVRSRPKEASWATRKSYRHPKGSLSTASKQKLNRSERWAIVEDTWIHWRYGTW